MPRRAKGPRLYLRKWKGCAATWVIRDLANEVSTGCTEADIAGAERRLADYIGQKHTPQTHESSPSRILISDVVNVYLKEHAPHVKNRQFLIYTAAPIGEWWGDKTLSTIRARTCRAYVEWRCAQGVSDQTARHDLKTLRAAVNYYHKEYGPLDAVPAFTLPEKSDPKSRHLSRSEAAAFLWHGRHIDRLKRMILIGLYTGTRSGAIKGLRWTTALRSGWVDIENGILYRKGEVEKGTDKRRPPCRIPPRLLVHMRRWHAHDTEKGISSVINDGYAGISEMRKVWNRARGKAGLGDDVTPHTLRHTCVSWRLKHGETIFDVAGFVGMSVEMVDRVYGHHSPVSPRIGTNESATIRYAMGLKARN